MAHEIGHHVLCPADLADNGRLLSRIRRALPNLEAHAPFIGNLYADLLINDRLQRSRGLRMDQVYARLGPLPSSPLWTMYLGIYEILWSLPAGTLTPAPVEPTLDGDAAEAAVRSLLGTVPLEVGIANLAGDAKPQRYSSDLPSAVIP